MATLSRSDVEHVAHLARLGLTDDELARLEGQLNHIVDQYAALAELDTEHIPPTAQTIELENILRDDVVRPSLERDEILGLAPQRVRRLLRRAADPRRARQLTQPTMTTDLDAPERTGRWPPACAAAISAPSN